jgi:EmrB/QacA subfamily drug resistance transporter
MDSALGQSKEKINVKLVVGVLLIGSFLAILNQTLLVTALPHIMKDLNIKANTAQWLTTAFLLTNGIMVPITAFLIEKFSTRRLYLTSLGIFTAGTLLAALSPNFPVLIAGRIIQAAGAGMMIPLMQTVLLVIFPVNKRGVAMGLTGLVIAFAPAIGPTLGGWIVDHYTWRYLFYLVFPISLITIIFTFFSLKNVMKLTHPRVDILSIILSTFGFGGLLYGFSVAGSAGWGSLTVIISIIVGAIALTVFIRRQLKMEKPLLDFRVFSRPLFTLTTILSMIVFVAMIGSETILPMYIQNVRGGSAVSSGLLLLPGAIVMGIMNPVSGMIYDKIGAKKLSIIGFSMLTLGSIPFFLLTSSTSLTFLSIAYVVRMFGLSLILMPLMTAALNILPTRLLSHGTAMSNTMRLVAGSIGTALLITIMSSVAASSSAQTQALSLLDGMNKALLCSFIFSILGIILSFYIREQQSNMVEEY